jgi:hypothetical protein
MNNNVNNFFNKSKNENFDSYHMNKNYSNNLSQSNIIINNNNNNNIENEYSEFFTNFEQLKILRCNDCFIIPLIYSVCKENDDIIVIYKCRCMRSNEIKPMEISLFLNKMNSIDIFSQVCFFCKNKEEKCFFVKIVHKNLK